MSPEPTTKTMLPATLSALLTQSLNDLQDCIPHSHYMPHYNYWHDPEYCQNPENEDEKQTCAICLSRAVMAQSLGVEAWHLASPIRL